MKAWQHFCTITSHKILVMKHCFRVGLIKQGLLHDMSKYSPSEFFVGCKYYQGTRSPNNAEREEQGYSSAWLHHKGRNKHHFEYWMDYSLTGDPILAGMRMPTKYVVEMAMDRIAAGKIYNGEAYTDQSPLEYFKKGKASQLMHPKVAKQLEDILRMLAEEGEEKTFTYVKNNIVKNAKRIDKDESIYD